MLTVRKSIYIGLGGTGVKSIAQTKKMFEDIFGLGNIPPQVTFIALDYDRSSIDEYGLATDISSDFVQLPLTVNPFLIYREQSQKGKYDWMPENNTLLIPEFMECGSGQVRTNARLFADLMHPCIEASINGAMAKVLSLANKQNGYIVVDDDHVNVYLAMSFAGGTGSSLMFSIANMIRERYDRACIIGYGVMHSIFNLMDPYNIVTPRIRQNTYASLLELDYFQSATIQSPIIHSLYGRESKLYAPLFDEFYVVDNKTQLGSMVVNLQCLCNAIGTSMFYGGTEVGKIHSISWTKRGLNWGQKSSWVHSFGVCQVVYKGAEMESLYRKAVAADMLNYLKGEQSCSIKRIHEWTERANLREDGNDYNKLIDWIYPSDKIAKIHQPYIDTSNSSEEIKLILRKYADNNSSLWKKQHIAEIIEDSIASLNKEVKSMLLDKGGVSLALSFLIALEGLFDGYKKEMESEKCASRDVYDKSASLVHDSLIEYDEKSNKFWSRILRRHHHCLEQIAISALNAASATIEIARRDDAITIFTCLINEVRTLRTSVADLSERMQILEIKYRDEIHKKEKDRENESLFEIDLSFVDASLLNAQISDNNLQDFKKLLENQNMSLLEMNEEEISLVLSNYTHSLPNALKFRERSIMDIIQSMSIDEFEFLKHDILRKSSPLLSLHDRGMIKVESNGSVSPIGNMLRMFYISAYKPDPQIETRFEGENELLAGDNVRVSFIPSDSESMRQRIFIHRVDSAIMPYCIESLEPSMADSGSRYNPYYGTDLQKTLQSLGYTLKPQI